MNEFDWNHLEDRPRLESIRVLGVDLRCGDRVRLCPGKRWPGKGADIMDMALEGQVATIEAIEQDYEENVHLAVVLEDDPGRDLGLARQPGHRFFFSVEEVEPMTLNDNQAVDTKSSDA